MSTSDRHVELNLIRYKEEPTDSDGISIEID